MRFLVFALLVSVYSFGHSALSNELEIEHFTEEIPVPTDFSENEIRFRTYLNNDGDVLIQLEQILNFGKKIWKVIEDNQPILNVKYSYANALPKGLKSSEDLEGFSNLNTRAFHVWGKNLYGIRVYSLEYVALHRHGGSFQGKGHYIENATILPKHVEVAWGYTLNYNVTNIGTVNVGRKEDPIASLVMETELSVSTVVKKSQKREAFEFRGDSGRVLVNGS